MTEIWDARAFRTALGCFVTGVTVVTSRAPDGSPVGMTVNSFNSVSLDPPLVLFSLARSAKSLAIFEQAPHYAVNLLSAEQREMSNRFARSLDDKWRDLNHEYGKFGTPLLPSTMAWFECKSYARYDGGDHVIFVGQVLDMYFDAAADPLVYYRGGYASLAPKV